MFVINIVKRNEKDCVILVCTLQKGVFIGPVANVPILLFSGFFVNLDSIPRYLRWLADVSYVRYGFEGAMTAVYGFNRTNLHCSEAYCHFKSPARFLEEMDMAEADYWYDCLVLVVFFFLLRILGFFMLKWNIYSRT